MKRTPDTIATLLLLLGLMLVTARIGVGCAPSSDIPAATYALTLEECSRNATSLCESVRCENHARAAMGRFPRAEPKSCKVEDQIKHDLNAIHDAGGDQ